MGEDIWPLTGRGATSRAFAAGELSVNIYEPLLRLGSDYSVQPGLAEHWEQPDALTWRFHLRPGVTFHDGRPFTADDVVWSWSGRELLPTAVTSTLAADGVRRVDDLTVDFVTTTPNLALPEQLVHPEAPIVPRGAHNDSNPAVGTGPYRLVSYQPHQQVTVERFDGYWGAKAKVGRLVFRFLPDAQSRVEALRSGEVDMVAGLPADAASSLQADAGFRVVKASMGATEVLLVSPTGQLGAPGDRALRQAVSLAVDRAAYVADVHKGLAEAGRWMAPPSVLGAGAGLVDASPYDPDQARRLLDGAGWLAGPDGTRTNGARRLDLTLIGGPAVAANALRFVASQLGAIGVHASVKKADDTVTYQQYRDKGFDLDLTVPHQNDANPAFLLAGRKGSDPDYQAFATQAAGARTNEEAQTAAGEMMRILVNRDVTVIPLAGVYPLFAMRRAVDIADPHPSSINQLWSGVTLS